MLKYSKSPKMSKEIDVMSPYNGALPPERNGRPKVFLQKDGELSVRSAEAQPKKSHKARILAVGSAFVAAAGLLTFPNDIAQSYNFIASKFNSNSDAIQKALQPDPNVRHNRYASAGNASSGNVLANICDLTPTTHLDGLQIDTQGGQEFITKNANRVVVIQANEAVYVPVGVKVGEVDVCGANARLRVDGKVAVANVFGASAQLVVASGGSVGSASIGGAESSVYQVEPDSITQMHKS